MRVCFYTLGCKVNLNETEALEQLFKRNGFTVVPDGEEARGPNLQGKLALDRQEHRVEDHDGAQQGVRDEPQHPVCGHHEHERGRGFSPRWQR